MSDATAPRRTKGRSLKRIATVHNPKGLHARASAQFVKMAGCFEAEITVTRCGQEVSGRSIMGLMMLAAGPLTEVEIKTTGPQAAEAMEALCSMIENRNEEY